MANELQLARKTIVELLEKQKPQITLALPKHLTADRICRIAITEMSKNPKLYECEPTSILASVIVAAQLGLEIGVNGQAYLVPYKGVCQLIPGWQGFVDLISRAGRASVWTGAVRDGDDFAFSLGSNPVLEHKPSDEDTGPFTYAYAVGWVKGAQWPVIEVWSRAKVLKHLKTYNKVGERHYALQGENNLEMYGRKVALLQVMKYMPKSIEIVQAQTLEYRGAEGQQKLTLAGVESVDAPIDGEYVDGNNQVIDADDPDGALRAKAEELMMKAGYNQALRTATAGKYKGKMGELVARLEGLTTETSKGTATNGTEPEKGNGRAQEAQPQEQQGESRGETRPGFNF